MGYPKFDKSELTATSTYKDRAGYDVPIYSYPISMKEAYRKSRLEKNACWVTTDADVRVFTPDCIPENVARGFMFQQRKAAREEYGGLDMFGVEWEYIDMAGGSMPKPGNPPILDDVNNWKEVIKIPDINAWDWEKAVKDNEDYLNTDRAVIMTLLNGCWFERLISFMEFEGAAMALLDDEQEDALKEMTHALTDLYIDIVDKVVEVWGDKIDGFQIHDDWGSQMAPFFNERIARELYLPEMKRWCDHVHSLGKIAELHSCGHIESRIEVFIEAGFDAWNPMTMNDTPGLAQKYGDKIVIGISNDQKFDKKIATEAEQRAAARTFVERFCKPGTAIHFPPQSNIGQLTPAFREEIYIASREAYSK